MPCIFIIDEPVEGDGRVKSAINDLCGNSSPEFINIKTINNKGNIISYAEFSILLMAALLVGLFKIKKIFNYINKGDSFFGGIRAALFLLWRSCKARTILREYIQNNNVECVYAADLYCAVTALPATGCCHVIYDSHELQFHRNRHTGWLRILLEVGLEQLVAWRVDEIWTVNKPLARIINDLHNPLPPIKVRPNNFYPYIPLSLPSENAPLAIVYVGKGTRGRRLEWLDTYPLPCNIYMFLLGAKLPPGIIGKGWNFGPNDYQDTLAHLAQSRRCFMWAVSELSCLSYRLALPNKFFQALAMGIPIISVKGSYLSEIVDDYKIGITASEETLSHLSNVVEIIERISYTELSLNAKILFSKISSGEVTL